MTLINTINILLSPTHGVLAYLDPGTGSFLIQLLIGSIVGGIVLIKAYWTRIRAFFSKSNPDQAEASSDVNQIETDVDNEQS